MITTAVIITVNCCWKYSVGNLLCHQQHLSTLANNLWCLKWAGGLGLTGHDCMHDHCWGPSTKFQRLALCWYHAVMRMTIACRPCHNQMLQADLTYTPHSQLTHASLTVIRAAQSCSRLLTVTGLVNDNIPFSNPTISTSLNRSLKNCGKLLRPRILLLCKIWWKSVHGGS